MNIDYDRLRQLVAEMEQGTAVTTRYIWIDLARELVRLRDELTDLRDTMYAHVDLLRGESRTVAADYAYRLTRIIQGDTK